MYSFVCLYTISLCIGSPFVIYGVWIREPVKWCHVRATIAVYAAISIGVWILMDILISVILCYLFIRPIKRILRDAYDFEITYVYVKYTILTYISIILNMIGSLLYLFKHLTTFIEISAAINCICIIMIYRRYQPVFDRCCGCAVNHCVKDKERKEIQIATNAVKRRISAVNAFGMTRPNIGHQFGVNSNSKSQFSSGEEAEKKIDDDI